MKARAGLKIRLTSVEELLGVANEESAMDLEIAKIRPFKDHPFKVLDDEKMQDLMESIRINGILSPVLVRPIGNDTYEMVSGHRRMHAAMMLGMDTVPAIIPEMTDDKAVVKMVDANIQREELLPSEKAFVYKMKFEAMKRQMGRPSKEKSTQIGWTFETAELVGKETGESKNQVRRYKVSLLDNAKGTVEHMFEYISGNLTPVTFEVYAAEDIKAADGIAPDYYKKEDLVGTITTDDTGIAKLGDLPVGKYYVQEKETAYGYVLDNAPRFVDLS